MKHLIVLLALLSIISFSCKKDKEESIAKPLLNGVVQKGPFLNGTAIDIYELDNSYSPTGKTFSSQLLDNSGMFQFSNLTLESPYIQIKANGYFFNEVTGQNSSSPVILFALSDITNKTSLNINVLSNLEKSRIEYLISQGASFSGAKSQAEQEILNIFSITKPDISEFETLNISQDGDDNAILLAISLITQGFRTESELSDLLANISTDIRQDGILNSSSLGSLLINDARFLNLQQIRTNLENRYSNLGLSYTIPDFEKYVNMFLDNTTYQPDNDIIYPEFSNYGTNALYNDKTDFDTIVSLAADLPKGTSLKIVIKNGWLGYEVLPDNPINWTCTQYDTNLEQYTFVVNESGKSCDIKIYFESSNTHIIEYYENNSTTPTKVKTITTN